MQHGRHGDIRAMSAFEIYLRTGRRPQHDDVGSDIEVKFNPWHDPDDGRFTFSGQGVYYGGGSNATSRSRTWGGGGFTGGGGGRGRGGGATGPGWSDPPRVTRAKPAAANSPPRMQAATPIGVAPKSSPQRIVPDRIKPALPTPAKTIVKPRPAMPADRVRMEVKNGYRFDIDRIERTQLVRGELKLDSSEGRSKRNQAEAGKPDRLPVDDGGHFVAVRFNGPRDKFNHFAQQSGINRGQYRLIEDEWARDLKAGRVVSVSIDPEYEAGSRRPYKVDVVWWVDGQKRSLTVPNPREK